MRISVIDLKTIVSYGGGIVLDAKSVPVVDLKTIASYASKSGAYVTLKNAAEINAIDLKTMASYSKGHIIFDFTN